MKKIIILSFLFFLISSVIITAYNHKVIASAMINHTSYINIGEKLYVPPETTNIQKRQILAFVSEAKQKITNKFGSFTATPVIIASYDMNKLKRYTNNSYGVTHFTLSNAYVVLGPEGLNIDVVSHELIHAEIFHRVGYFNRLFNLPVWFDEGVAMQVDNRKAYNHSPKNIEIHSLKYGWQFFRGNVKNHYSLAKSDVKTWLNQAGDTALYKLLNDINEGHNFRVTYAKYNKEFN